MKTTVASFLFADVKGYSNLEERHIKCFYEDILPELKVRIDNYREALQDINTWGDGLMIVSEDPYELSRLALDIRDFYNNYNWKSKGMPELVVRISLHHGTIYKGIDPFRERESIIGTGVTLGARLEPTTVPGQIWVTQEFRGMIKERDSSIQFQDIGQQELAKNHGIIKVYRLVRKAEFLVLQSNNGTNNSQADNFIHSTNNENINTIPSNNPSSPSSNTSLNDEQVKAIEKLSSILEEKAPLIPNSKDIIPSNNSSSSKNNTSQDSEQAKTKIEMIHRLLEELKLNGRI